MENYDLDSLISILQGKSKDNQRQAYSIWKHFPGQDLQVKDLVQAHIDFQNIVNADLIKISPHSKFALVDFGVEFNPKEYNNQTGSYITKKYPVQTIKDWERIDEFDPQTGELGKQLDVIKQLAKEFPNTPKMMTIFLPVMIARKLVKDDKYLNHLKEDKKLVQDRLQAIVKVIKNFSEICLETGSEGLFLATQETEKNKSWSEKIWLEAAYPYDKAVIDAIKTKSEFQILHLHGENIFFKAILKKFQVSGINFHAFPDFQEFFTSPTITSVFNGGLLGGLEDSYFDVPDNQFSDTEVIEQLIHKIRSIKKRTILSPNCVLPQKTSSERLNAIITKIRS